MLKQMRVLVIPKNGYVAGTRLVTRLLAIVYVLDFLLYRNLKAGLYTNYRLLLDSAYIIGEMNVYLGLISADTSDPQSLPEEEEEKGK